MPRRAALDKPPSDQEDRPGPANGGYRAGIASFDQTVIGERNNSTRP